MELPILYKPEYKTAVIYGYSKKALEYALMLEDFDFEMQIVYETEEEKEKWGKAHILGKESAPKGKDWLSLKTCEVSMVIAGKESFVENEKILEKAKEQKIPLRASVTHSFLSNFFFPPYLKNKVYGVSLYDESNDSDLTEPLLKEIFGTITIEELENKYQSLSKALEMVMKDSEELERLKDSLPALFNLDKQDLDSAQEAIWDKVDKHLVIGVSDNPYDKLQLERLCDEFLENNQDWSIDIEVVDLNKLPNQCYGTAEGARASSDFLDRVEANYNALSKMLLDRQIDLAFINPMHLAYRTHKGTFYINSSLYKGISLTEIPSMQPKDFVILNKYGIKSLDSVPPDSHFLFDEFDLFPQLHDRYGIKPWNSELLSIKIEDYAEDKQEKPFKEFLTFFRKNLDLLGYNDEKLSEMGLTVIEDYFAHPLDYGSIIFLHRTNDLLAENFMKFYPSYLKDYGDIGQYFMLKIMESYFWEHWHCYYKSNMNDLVLSSLKRIDDENIRVTLFGRKSDSGFGTYYSETHKVNDFEDLVEAIEEAVDEVWYYC